MENRTQLIVRALKHFDFDRHRAHRWLLLQRNDRESLLAEAGLLQWVDWHAEPIHLGNIERVSQVYTWGQVVFRPLVEGMDADMSCSVYAGFDYLIRKCALFPTFISLSDVVAAAKSGADALPVYGARFDLSKQPRKLRPATIHRMLDLHGIERDSELLAEQGFEVSDEDLFRQFFAKHVQDQPSAAQ